jgi:hypothetical protein
MNVKPVRVRPSWCAFPGAAEEVDAVAAQDNAAEDFLEVKLGTAGLWIFKVLPVQNEYPH